MSWCRLCSQSPRQKVFSKTSRPYDSQRTRDKSEKLPLQDEYSWGEHIGEGAFGKILQCTRIKDDQVMACKIIQVVEKKNTSKEIKLEIELMNRMAGKHPNFLKIYDYRKQEDKYYIFMEMCSGGTLKATFKRLTSEEDIRTIMRQLVSALVYMHSKKLVHSDIKLENIALVDEEGLRIKLLDFGLSKRQKRAKRLKEVRGTFSYMAPEVAKKQGYTQAADMWSAGALLYRMLVKKSLFLGKQILKENAVTSKLQNLFKREKWVSNEVKRLLVIHPPDRMTAREALTHSFLASGPDDAFSRNLMQSLDLFIRRGTVQDALLPVMEQYYKEKNSHLMKKFYENELLDENQFLEICENISTSHAAYGMRIFTDLDYDEKGTVHTWKLFQWLVFDYVMGENERLIELIETKLVPGCEDIGWEIVDKAIKDYGVNSNVHLGELKEMFIDGKASVEKFAWMILANYAPPMNEELKTEMWSSLASSSDLATVT